MSLQIDGFKQSDHNSQFPILDVTVIMDTCNEEGVIEIVGTDIWEATDENADFAKSLTVCLEKRLDVHSDRPMETSRQCNVPPEIGIARR
jgi:hypothetical protein